MKIHFTKQQFNIAKQLFIIAAVCLFIIYGLFLLTQTAAQNSEKRYLIKSLSKVLPQHSFDNNLLSTKTITDNAIIYQACYQGEPRYQVYEISTDKGYSGLIRLLVSVDLQRHTIIHSRPLFHQETPGLGDQIEVEKSSWLEQFNQSLTADKKTIAVKQDKGNIDAITGATITSRAVSNLIRQHFYDKPVKQLPNLCEAQ